jgi:hypothetical protein
MPYGLNGPFSGCNLGVQGDPHRNDCISSGEPRDNESIQGDPCGMPSIDALQGYPCRATPIDPAQGSSFELPTNLKSSAAVGNVDEPCNSCLQGSAFAPPTNPLTNKLTKYHVAEDSPTRLSAANPTPVDISSGDVQAVYPVYL